MMEHNSRRRVAAEAAGWESPGLADCSQPGASVPVLSELATLPIPELCIALFLFAVSHILGVGQNYSLLRAGVLLALCSLVILYGYFRNPYTPYYCYAFLTPIFTGFGTVFALILGGTLLILSSRKICRLKWQFTVTGLAFCLWMVLSLAWGRTLYLGEDGFLFQTLPAMVLAMVVSSVRDPIFRRNLVLLVVISCVIGCMGSLRNWLFGIHREFGYGRIYALIPPDVFSAWLLLGIFGAWAWVLGGRVTLELKIALAASIPLMLLGIGLCGYRAAILAVALGAFIVSIFQKALVRGLIICAILAGSVLLIYFAEPDMFHKVSSRFLTIHQDQGSGRFAIWRAGLHVFSFSPIVGVGVDNFRFAVIDYLGVDWVAHSIYIGTLVELGIVGCLLLFFWQANLLMKTWRSKERILVFTLMVVFLFQGIFLHEFQFGCFWLAIGLAEGCPQPPGVSQRQIIRTSAAPAIRRFVSRRLSDRVSCVSRC